MHGQRRCQWYSFRHEGRALIPLTKRLILQIQWGPQAQQKAILEPGETLRVGQALGEGSSFQGKQLAVTQDAQMAKAHFDLSWDGRTCRLRDLKSAAGTQADGRKVEEAELSHGGWIRAGMTDFLVYVEGFTPPRRARASDSHVLEDVRTNALEVLRHVDAQLFAVLDASQDIRIPELLRESVEESCSLYRGTEGETLADVAPYLVALPKGSVLLESLVAEGWGRNWGVYLTCPLPFADVRRHLRKFLMVEAEGMPGQLYFRFYDPRVLRVFLPTCPPTQREDFWGRITWFITEGTDAEVLKYS